MISHLSTSTNSSRRHRQSFQASSKSMTIRPTAKTIQFLKHRKTPAATAPKHIEATRCEVDFLMRQTAPQFGQRYLPIPLLSQKLANGIELRWQPGQIICAVCQGL